MGKDKSVAATATRVLPGSRSHVRTASAMFLGLIMKNDFRDAEKVTSTSPGSIEATRISDGTWASSTGTRKVR